MKIAQITDIHIGGDYNGKYKVKENFEKVVNDINDVDLIVVSGDLADCNYEENYAYVKTLLDSKKINYIVLGGNHDNCKVLKKVFVGNFVEEFNHIYPYLSFVDTSEGFLSKDVIKKIPKNSIVFTHYPLVPVVHKFMNNYSLKNLKETKELLIKQGINEVFCGHFHFSYDELGSVNIHITPSTQCQIDAKDENFKVSSYRPGYRIIEITKGNITKTFVRYL